MFSLISLCISTVNAAPDIPSSNLSLYLQRMVRNTPHAEISQYLDDHGWGSPLQKTTEYDPQKSYDKGVRNAYAGQPNSIESSNFVIWYGTPDGFSERNVESLSVEMEYIWATLIDEMEYPTPEGTDAWKFNVYIGDTGSGVPSAEGAAGYFWYDTENYPMIVLSKDIISWTDSAKLTGGHEFYHAVQAAINTYRFNDSALWWHEATSNWILEELYRDEGGYSNTLYSVALRPEISLNHWGDYLTEGIEADHHYGASIFGTFLSEFRGGPELIKRSFVEAPVNSDPLDVFETLLQENGESLVDAHLEYALRNTTWDYEFESDYEMSVADYNGGGESHRSSGTISGLSDDWHGPGDWKPQTFGSNSWALENLPAEFQVEFEGETGITWRVGIAQQEGTEHRRWIMPADAQSWALTDFVGGDEAWLVIAAVDDNSDDGESHSYQFKITEPVEEAKGGCATLRFQSVGWFGLLMVAMGIRTRE